MFQKLSTQKGKMSVAWNGYIYTQKRLTANHIHWRCMDRNCNASLKTPIYLDDPDVESFFCIDDSSSSSTKARLNSKASC